MTNLLALGEAALVENPDGGSPFVLLGDHAGNVIPPSLFDLGVSATDLTRHIAWDIGVAGVGTALSKRLDAPFVRQRYSRLVIDCNRALDSNGLIVEVSDGTPVPGNVGLTSAQRQARIADIHTPYHQSIAALLAARRQRAMRTLLVSVHSFTPALGDGVKRPWQVGVLHRGDSRYAHNVYDALQPIFGHEVGDNQPYAMDGIDFTIPLHADAYGFEYVEIEIRQDLIGDEKGQADMAALLAPLLVSAAR
ncbi:MAG: N-formylglutamate amidohydrolase [Alphaproteobacteria bacterium]